MPMKLFWPNYADLDINTVPLVINTVQHPLPSPKRGRDAVSGKHRLTQVGSRSPIQKVLFRLADEPRHRQPDGRQDGDAGD